MVALTGFVILIALQLYADAAEFMIRCESWDWKHQDCRINDRIRHVELTKQISGDCVFGRSWNRDDHRVWVNGGCRGEFYVYTDGRRKQRFVQTDNRKQRFDDKKPVMAKFFKTKRINKPIVIDKPGVYDFKNVLHEWVGPHAGRCYKGIPAFHALEIRASDVTIRNFAYIGAPKGMHIAGKKRFDPVRNIVLENVYGYACEVALWIRHVWNLKIQHSTFRENPDPRNHYHDKITILGPNKAIHIQNSIFIGAQTCILNKAGSIMTVKWSAFYNCRLSGTFADTCPYGCQPAEQAKVVGRENYFRDGHAAYGRQGDVVIDRWGDTYKGLSKEIRDLGWPSEHYCKTTARSKTYYPEYYKGKC